MSTRRWSFVVDLSKAIQAAESLMMALGKAIAEGRA